MKNNQARRIVMHDDGSSDSLSNSINEFHVQMIEQKLYKITLTTKQKIDVIDKIIENLKSRDVGGIIK